MAVSLEQFKSFCGVKDQNADSKVPALTAALETSIDLLDAVLSNAYREIPESVRDRLVLEVGQEFYKRQDSPTGNSQTVDFSTGQPVAGPRDPLARVWPIVRRYVLPF